MNTCLGLFGDVGDAGFYYGEGVKHRVCKRCLHRFS